MAKASRNTSSPKRSIAADYLSGDDKLRPFYHYSAQNIDWQQILEARTAVTTDRATLTSALHKQYASLPATEAVHANLRLLEKPNTFTITTGQQPGLFGGPLYVWYKTLSVILLCQDLSSKFPQYNFVPVFWVAGEDHDFAEVNHTYLSFEDKRVYTGMFKGAVGRHVITQPIQPAGAGMPDWLTQFYGIGECWGTAFVQLLHHVFGHQGLVVLNADKPELKLLFAPIMVHELTGSTSHTHITAQAEKLAASGYPVQLTPREINLFYLTDEARLRIERRDADTWGLAYGDRRWNRNQLLQELSEHPERFSPNAALRPLYQETILPNLCYVGGWGEIAYWLELLPVFNQHQTPYPLLLPRISRLLVSSEDWQIWQQHGLTHADFSKRETELVASVTARHWQHDFNNDFIDQAGQTLHKAFETLALEAEKLDSGQARNVRGQLVRTRRFLNNLTHKLGTRLARKHPQWSQPIRSIKNKTQPDGTVQERALNVAAFAHNSPENLLQALLLDADPYSSKTEIGLL